MTYAAATVQACDSRPILYHRPWAKLYIYAPEWTSTTCTPPPLRGLGAIEGNPRALRTQAGQLATTGARRAVEPPAGQRLAEPLGREHAHWRASEVDYH
jgi:hypothetical protein